MALVPDSFALPARTLTGRNCILHLLPLCSTFGHRGLLLFGGSLQRAGALARIMETRPTGVELLPYQHEGGEPTLGQLRALLQSARAFRAEWVAAVGGGSVLDLGKACAGLLHAREDVTPYHEGRPIDCPGIPFAAAPTTAGTGAECTINAVFTNEDTDLKKSIRDEALSARLIILDPCLLASCPRPVLAAAGMDAFTQALEAYTSIRASWLSDQFALKGLSLLATNLPLAFADPAGAAAERLLLGSYFTGIALGLSRLGIVHGLAHPLGAFYKQPHGQVCAACLPYAVEWNRDAMGVRYATMSQELQGDLLSIVRDLIVALDLHSPFQGAAMVHKEEIISQTLASGSTKAGARQATRADVEWFLARLFAP